MCPSPHLLNLSKQPHLQRQPASFSFFGARVGRGAHGPTDKCQVHISHLK